MSEGAEVTIGDIARLRERARCGCRVEEAVRGELGGKTLARGLIRIHRESQYEGAKPSWPAAWGHVLAARPEFVGEDVFGNQLAIVEGTSNLRWWCHETGAFEDLELTPLEWIELVLKHGCGWMSQYDDGSLDAAAEYGPVAASRHLHWIKPRTLGGATTRANCAELERVPHLIGHAEMWRQLEGLPPGTEIVA